MRHVVPSCIQHVQDAGPANPGDQGRRSLGVTRRAGTRATAAQVERAGGVAEPVGHPAQLRGSRRRRAGPPGGTLVGSKMTGSARRPPRSRSGGRPPRAGAPARRRSGRPSGRRAHPGGPPGRSGAPAASRPASSSPRSRPSAPPSRNRSPPTGSQSPAERPPLPCPVHQEERVQSVVGQGGVAGRARRRSWPPRRPGATRGGPRRRPASRRVGGAGGRVGRTGGQELEERRPVPDQEGRRAHPHEVVVPDRRPQLHGHAPGDWARRRTPPGRRRDGRSAPRRCRPADEVGRRRQAPERPRGGEGAPATCPWRGGHGAG